MSRVAGELRTWREAELEADGWAWAYGEIDCQELERRIEWTLVSRHSEHCSIFDSPETCSCGGPNGPEYRTSTGQLDPIAAYAAQARARLKVIDATYRGFKLPKGVAAEFDRLCGYLEDLGQYGHRTRVTPTKIKRSNKYTDLFYFTSVWVVFLVVATVAGWW